MKRTSTLCILNTLVYILPLNTTPSSTTIYRYLWANYQQFAGNTATASDLYQELLKEKPSYSIYKGYIHHLFETKKFTTIKQLIPSLEKQFANDADIGLIFVKTDQILGNHNSAANRLILLNNTFKTDTEIAFNTAQTYLNRKEPENALQVIETLLNSGAQKPNNFIFHFLKAQIHLELNNKDLALESIQTCLEMQPNFDKAWLFMAILQEQAGNLKQAIKGYTNYLNSTQESQQHSIEQKLINLIFLQKITTTQKEYLLNNECFKKALLLFEKREYEKALESIDKCLIEAPNDTTFRLFKLQTLSAMKTHTEAIHLITTWITEEPHNTLWTQTLYLMYRDGADMQASSEAFELLHKQFPENSSIMGYLADIHTRSQQYTKALSVLKKMLPLCKTAIIKAQLHFQIGFIHFQQQHYAAMKKALTEGMQYNQQYPPLLNLLAHYYATQERDFKQAQVLITKARNLDNENPHFKDTQAMIYYKSGDYDKALALLADLAPTLNKDFTIIKNLSKIHYKKGDTQQAIAYMEQALPLAHSTYEKNKCKKLLKEWKLKK